MRQHLALVGFMASGKSTVGQRLATIRSQPFVDLDQRIELEAGLRIPEIFEEQGEAAFRQLEAQVLRTVLKEQPCVLATGGGTVQNPGSRALLRSESQVVWLDLRFDTVRSRLASDEGAQRPLARSLSEQEMIALYHSRRVGYAASAQLRVEVDRRSPVQLARWIQGALEALSSDPRASIP